MSERKVALVTGGARRVGRAIVETLAEAGYDVAFTYHASEGDADELAERHWSDADQAYRVHKVLADLTEPATFDGAILAKIDELGRLDLFVHNASIYRPDPPTPAERSELARRMHLAHADAAVRLLHHLGPLLRRTNGSVVNMLDVLAERPMPAYSTYCASKAALWNATLSLARELAPDVRVNGIAPGVVAWPDDMPEPQRQKYLEKVPLKRAGTPQDVARLVRFLAEEAPYITGQVIRLDGGRSIAW